MNTNLQNPWIDIVEYSTKYGVSQSTIRRRIRSKTIEFRLEGGKYLLHDSREVINRAPLFSRQTTKMKAPKSVDTPIYTVNNSELDMLKAENRRLKMRISELETLIKVFETST